MLRTTLCTPRHAHLAARTAQLVRREGGCKTSRLHAHCEQADISAEGRDMVDRREFPKKPIAQAAFSCGLAVGSFVAWDRLVRGVDLSREDVKWLDADMKEVAGSEGC